MSEKENVTSGNGKPASAPSEIPGAVSLDEEVSLAGGAWSLPPDRCRSHGPRGVLGRRRRRGQRNGVFGRQQDVQHDQVAEQRVGQPEDAPNPVVEQHERRFADTR